jgi:signal transduction histidine kinase
MRQNGDDVKVDVQDNGIGIAPTDQERFFERFYRSVHALVLAMPGTGLGLAIVKQLVNIRKGQIWVRSTGVPGKGSTYSFTLTVQQTEE